MLKNLAKKLLESALSVLPIAIVTIAVALIFTDIDGLQLASFSIGAVFLIVGICLFTLGADIAMLNIGREIGAYMSKSRKMWFILLISFIMGVIITIAEPDLTVLAKQIGSNTIIYIVALSVGVFLVVSMLRTFLKIKLSYLLLALYGIVFILAIFAPKEFVPLSFDSGGVTTGPITVPFIMSLGIGLASVRGGNSSTEDSFGTIALCSIGPILAMLILSMTSVINYEETSSNVLVIDSFRDVVTSFLTTIPHTMKEVAIALLPIAVAFIVFQIFFIKLPKAKLLQIIIGFVYTYLGLTIFLTGVNAGFMPMGSELGSQLAGSEFKWLLVPLGALIGALVMLAEPAVHVLNKQVEELTGGAIKRSTMLVWLCIGVSIAVALSMVRVLTGISIWWILAPMYGIALVLTFFVPTMFTAIAFDSGGVASGPLTATFMLPLATGACAMLNGDILTDAYGLVAFVALAPLVTIQLLGLIYTIKLKLSKPTIKDTELQTKDSEIVDFDIINIDTEEINKEVDDNGYDH